MQPVFVIVEAEPVVLQDLTEILSLSADGAEVAGFCAVTDAADWLDHAGRVDLLFLGTLDVAEAGPVIAQRAEDAGGRVVLVGERTRSLSGAAAPIFLETPFTNASVTEFIARWRGPPGRSA